MHTNDMRYKEGERRRRDREPVPHTTFSLIVGQNAEEKFSPKKVAGVVAKEVLNRLQEAPTHVVLYKFQNTNAMRYETKEVREDAHLDVWVVHQATAIRRGWRPNDMESVRVKEMPMADLPTTPPPED